MGLLKDYFKSASKTDPADLVEAVAEVERNNTKLSKVDNSKLDFNNLTQDKDSKPPEDEGLFEYVRDENGIPEELTPNQDEKFDRLYQQSDNDQLEIIDDTQQTDQEENIQQVDQEEDLDEDSEEDLDEDFDEYEDEGIDDDNISDEEINRRLSMMDNPFKEQESNSGLFSSTRLCQDTDPDFEVYLPPIDFNYRAKPKKKIVTEAERIFYLHLCKILPQGLSIHCKVRLFDLVNVSEKQPKLYRSSLQMHADFVLIDNKTLSPVLVIELDDRSHLGNKRRDNRKDKLLKESGIPILRVVCARSYNLTVLKNLVNKAVYRI